MNYLNVAKKFLSINEQKTSWKILILLMIISYAFSIAIRYIWVLQVENIPSYKWNDQIMINTNDGYFFAQGAKDILNDTKLYPSSPVKTMTSKLTAFFATILPFSFESIILYMPAFLGSLLIIPILLIARSLNMVYVGFGASLIAGIAWSYYNRTMIGYYDTDMLNIVLPTFITALLIHALHKKQLWILPIITATMLFFNQWYQTSFFYTPLLFSALFYILVYDRKSLYNYQLLSIYMISMSNLGFWKISILVILITAFFYWANKNIKKELLEKIIYSIFGVSVVLALMSGGLVEIYSKLEIYVFRQAISDNISLVFFNVANTVREAGIIPFEVFANRISGGVFLLFLSTIGVILLLIRYPMMILTLPLMAVGFVALKGGLRFTVYTVPVNALGMSFVIFLLATYARNIFSHILPLFGQRIVYYSIIVSMLSVNLYYHIEHIKGYIVPTVFNKKEVALLDTINKRTTTKDYVISWWDYGYPIRYYAQTQTLIDGGIHNGVNNFPVSFSLLRPMTASANMLRLAVEYNEKHLIEPRAGSHIAQMITDYKSNSPKEFLESLNNKSFNPPSPTREIYLYMPLRMLNIFPTVALFSNLDIGSGRKFNQPLFFNSPIRSSNANEVNLAQGIKIFRKDGKITGQIQISGNTYNIKYFVRTFYDKNMKLQRTSALIDKNSGINVIYMQDYGKFIITDDQTFNSTYVQLFMLENFDTSLFEPVALDPQVKVYRLKI